MAQGDDGAFDWQGYIDGLVAERGSLAAVAERLSEQRGHREQIESIERGLRRLRGRGTQGGGVWGQRVLRAFGLPAEVEARVRWMGQYHTRFSDLPASLGLELLRPWDRPPVSEGPARVWVQLGLCSVALRRQQPDLGLQHLDQADRVGAQAPVAAQIERLLTRSFLVSRTDPPRSLALLEEAAPLLDDAALDDADRACLRARWVDQRAWRLNKGVGEPRDPAAAEALYQALPLEGPPFARCRRENGLGWSRLLQGDRAAAQAHARASVTHAGDGGSLRLRAMALNLLSAASEGTEEGALARARALDIARRLEDESLRLRFTRPGRRAQGQ